MTRRPTAPLRRLTPDERACLETFSRAQRDPASAVLRAKALLAVADGASYTAAAAAVGLRVGDTVRHWVARFNAEGLGALLPRHGGGARTVYAPQERERILAEARRVPDRARDGTATWSLTTLRRALRRAPDGLPDVSTYTIWVTLHEAGYRWQRSRTWCPTGVAERRRARGTVLVFDPDAAAKKN